MRDEAVALEKGGDGLVFIRTDRDAKRVRKGRSLETFHFRSHCSREEIGAALSREDSEDFRDDSAKVCWS